MSTHYESGKTEDMDGPEGETPGDIGAYFKTPQGGFLRVRHTEREHGHVHVLELVQPETGAHMRAGRVTEGDKTVIPIWETADSRAVKAYNHMLEPLLRAELAAAREAKAEAKRQGDAITFHAQAEYIEELQEQLGDYR